MNNRDPLDTFTRFFFSRNKIIFIGGYVCPWEGNLWAIVVDYKDEELFKGYLNCFLKALTSPSAAGMADESI